MYVTMSNLPEIINLVSCILYLVSCILYLVSCILLRRLTSEKVARTFFTDETIFTVAPPINTQNNRVYAPRNKLKADIADDRLFVTRSHSSKSVMVLVGVSKLGKTTLHFVNPSAR